MAVGDPHFQTEAWASPIQVVDERNKANKDFDLGSGAGGSGRLAITGPKRSIAPTADRR